MKISFKNQIFIPVQDVQQVMQNQALIFRSLFHMSKEESNALRIQWEVFKGITNKQKKNTSKFFEKVLYITHSMT